MERLLILIILYKLSPKSSATLLSLQKCCVWLLKNNHYIIVRDNSPAGYSDTVQSELSEMFVGCALAYQYDGRNQGLSQIYNGIIKTELTEGDFLLLLDHDTTFDVGLLESFETARNLHPKVNLFLPIIRSGNAIVSPSHQHWFKGTYWHKARQGVIPTQHVTAINSAMFISGCYLCKQFRGYDERMTFYGTDNYFMWQYGLQNETLCVLDYTVNHVLNFYADDEPIERKVSRFREMRRASLLLEAQRHPWLYALVYLYWDIFGIKCAIKQGSPKFLWLR